MKSRSRSICEMRPHIEYIRWSSESSMIFGRWTTTARPIRSGQSEHKSRKSSMNWEESSRFSKFLVALVIRSIYWFFRMDDIIRDVFIDYTKNYMTPEDVITGSGPFKWSFGSSIFFSWTAITTIGKWQVPIDIYGEHLMFYSFSLHLYLTVCPQIHINFALN